MAATQPSPPASSPGLRDLDQAPDYQRSFDRLDTSSLPTVRDYKEVSYALLKAGAGSRVLDVGCGLGDDVRRLAAFAPDSCVVGLDASAATIGAARARSLDCGARVQFHVGSIYSLPFPNQSFDAVRADRVLHFLNDPARAIADMKRVLKPGGRLVASEPDNGSIVIDAGDQVLTGRLLEHRRKKNDALMPGISLGRLFAEAGLRRVELQAHTGVIRQLEVADRLLGLSRLVQSAVHASVISLDEASGWLLRALRDSRAGHFAVAMTVFIATGTND
jgi:SAM-dependent methyltransferase